jgi:Mn2+/Fe2+ NRAMP family transporter
MFIGIIGLFLIPQEQTVLIGYWVIEGTDTAISNVYGKTMADTYMIDIILTISSAILVIILTIVLLFKKKKMQKSCK